MSERVLLVSGPVAGGIRRHLESLARGLPPLGWEPALAAPASVPLGVPLPRFPVELGDRPRPAADMRALPALRRAAAEWRPDVIHAQGVKAALLCLLAFPGGAPPAVISFQNLWHGGPLTVPLRLLAGRAAATVAITGAVRDSLASHGIPLRGLHVIPNGIDPTRFSPAPARDEGPFTVAFLGRLTEEKGVPMLLEMARLLDPEAGIRLLVAGDGPLRGLVEQAAREGLLTYLGQQEDAARVYHAADAVVMPSLSEGQGLTAVEAMACGLPVVASRVGGLAEVVLDSETGLLVPPGDAGAAAAAVRRLAAAAGLRAVMGTAGRRRVLEHFTEDVMLRRLTAVYAGVAPGALRKR